MSDDPAQDNLPGMYDDFPRKQKNKTAKALPNVEHSDADAPEGGTMLLSKKQKEKLRKQRQKEQSKGGKGASNGGADEELDEDLLAMAGLDAAEPVEPEASAVSSEPSTTADVNSEIRKNDRASGNRKKKATGPSIADLQRMLAAQRAAEEEALRLAEEERRREEEEQKRLEEEERLKEEQRAIKREREKAKREKLRQEGKLLTKAQKEAQARNKIRLQQLLASGVIVKGLQENEQQQSSTNEPSKDSSSNLRPRSVQKPRNDNNRNRDQKQVQNDAATVPVNTEPVAVQPKDQETVTPNQDTENNIIERPPSPSSDDDDDDDIKDCWEDSSDDEDVVQVDSKPKTATAKTAKSSVKPPTMTDTKTTQVVTLTKKHMSNDSKADLAKAESKKPSQSKQKDEPASEEPHLRSPICCILGHVDTGKTKLLDKIRQTNVQEGEAGGITQQIGATYFPVEAIRKKTAVMNMEDFDIKVPGLLIIDTPGHESFTNLRSRGSSLCNIAILVVDIMHGLQQQTLESLNLLKQRKTPFIIALNKIDRIYEWNSVPNDSFANAITRQSPSVVAEFESRLEKTKLRFAELGMNTELYTKNKNMGKFVSILPTSAISGEGIPDMLYMLVNLTQNRMSSKLLFVGELEATVLEVKVVEGLGMTIDVILSNGVLNEGDKIVVCGLDGAIVTTVRALLTPQPMRELRVKSHYVHHKSIKAAMGVKISAQGLDGAVAGSRLLVVKPGDDEEELRQEAMRDLQNLLSSVDKSGRGVWVQASTLGSLEALIAFLLEMKIPVFGINIGPVHRKDVVRASVMLQHAKEYAVMLCFDVKVEREAQEFADDMGVKIFRADIIYHLFDMFKNYFTELVELKRKDAAPVAIFPCVLRIVPGAIFNKRDPIIIGVEVVEGVLRVGTPLCVNEMQSTGDKLIIPLGKVVSMEVNHKCVETVRKGQSGSGVAIKIECPSYDTPKMYGRHFGPTSELLSQVSRQSIDMLKENFKQDMTKEDWALMIKLKKVFGIM